MLTLAWRICKKYAAQFVDYPQSTKGRGGYPPSGGGISDGGKLPHDVPILPPIKLPEYKEGDQM